MKTLLATTVLSVMLLVSGTAFAHDQRADDHGKDGEHSYIESTLSKLPEADATKFREAMKASHAKDEATLDKLQKLHEESKTLLSAETFDKAAYLAKSREITKLHDKLDRHMKEAFADAVADLPQDERKLFAENMAGGDHGHHHGHHDKTESEKTDSGTKEE